jgi:photosystem II stability/assembly factor-like uncharacterized protein
MKSLVFFFIFSSVVLSQVHHNIWYGFGPFGGTVSEIAVNNRGNISAITNGGLSFFYYDWIHMYNAGEFIHSDFLSSSDTLLAANNTQLFYTTDVGYHWHNITSLQNSTDGITSSRSPSTLIFCWKDSLLYRGDLDSTSWFTINPEKGKVNKVLLNQHNNQFVIMATEEGLFRSTDAGESWLQLNLPEKNYISIACDNIPPYKLSVIASDSNIVYLSSNNGDTWISSTNGLPPTSITRLSDVAIDPTGKIFVSSGEGVFRTVNFGITWSGYSAGLEYPDLGILMTLPVHTINVSGNKLYAGTDEGIFENSTGMWQQIGTNNQKCLTLAKSQYYYDIVLLGTPRGVKRGMQSYWSPTNNYGLSGFPINSIILSSTYDSIALAAGIFPELNGFIQKSTNAGSTWQTVFNLPIGSGKFNQFIQRKDSMNIYLALSDGINSSGLYIADVINSPDTWSPVEGTNGMNFISASSFNNSSNKIFFIVDDSLFYQSSDGGRTVQYLSTVPGGKFSNISCVFNGINRYIFACGNGIRISYDDGITWEDFGLNQYEVVKVIFESWSLIAATKNNGFFIKYHSKGDWTDFSYGFGKGKVIMDLVNYTSWVMHAATENHSVYYMWLIVNDASEENNFTSAHGYVLKQNYPNPFNPVTTISYQIKEPGLVQLKVFNVLGQEVSVLVNEVKSEGSYSINFDASNLPTGVYIYSLRVNNFIQNNKMSLLK